MELAPSNDLPGFNKIGDWHAQAAKEEAENVAATSTARFLRIVDPEVKRFSFTDSVQLAVRLEAAQQHAWSLARLAHKPHDSGDINVVEVSSCTALVQIWPPGARP